MVWWDERSVGAIASEPSAADAAGPRRLRATVDLEDPYLRDIVLEALKARPEWTVDRADGDGFDPHPSTAASDFHWWGR